MSNAPTPAPADYLEATRSLYDSLGYTPYRWAERTEPVPLVAPARSLSDSRVLLIGSGGIYRHGQVAFATKDDTSIRTIASETAASELRTAHFAYDQTDAREDPNCVFPLGRLRELAAEGVIGGMTDHAAAFMGGIYSVRRFEAETVPSLISLREQEEPDVVLLVPV
ncbi:MAG: glycine/sarcosine/betaine reductase selenoprotein B family protein [Acidimicrobiales bacterium]